MFVVNLRGVTLTDVMRDLKYTLRRLARTPVFTLATIVTLALGIGANTAVFRDGSRASTLWMHSGRNEA